MAEFQEVIKNWARMLDAHKKGESIALEASVPADAFKDAKLVENIVMSWAADHSEPVYPTWYEWLKDNGLTFHDAESSWIGFTERIHHPIPADIAQKLGIEPIK